MLPVPISEAGVASLITRGASSCTGAREPQKPLLVRAVPPDPRARRARARAAEEDQLDIPLLVEHVGRDSEVEALRPWLAPVTPFSAGRDLARGVPAQERDGIFANPSRRPRAPRAATTRYAEPAAELHHSQAATSRQRLERVRAPPARARPSRGGTHPLECFLVDQRFRRLGRGSAQLDAGNRGKAVRGIKKKLKGRP